MWPASTISPSARKNSARLSIVITEGADGDGGLSEELGGSIGFEMRKKTYRTKIEKHKNVKRPTWRLKLFSYL
jgi:hypothetical protein